MGAGHSLNDWDYAMITMSTILLFVLLPTTICFAHSYTANLNHIVLQKRYSHIVFYEIIIFIVKLICSSAVFITIAIAQNFNSFNVIFSRMIANVIAYLLYLTWVWRFYLLMYDINWITAAKNDHWQHVINPTYRDLAPNWFLQNRKKYGNIKWTFTHLFVPILVIGILFQNIHFYMELTNINNHYPTTFHDFNKLMDPIIGSIPLILLLSLYYKIPSFHDKFYIHAEIQRILIALIMQYVAFFCTIFISLIFPSSPYFTISYFVSILMEFIAMSIATKWVSIKVADIIDEQLFHLRKFESKSRNDYLSIDSPRNYVFKIAENKVSNSRSEIILKNFNNNENNLDQLLSSNQGFSLFMMQLSHEFSQEILLSFVEMLMFQQLIISYCTQHDINIDNNSMNKSKSDVTLYTYFPHKEFYELITFPSNVPKSYIIYGAYQCNSNNSVIDDDDIVELDEYQFVKKLKSMIWKLYEKYVCTNSLYQINIPYQTERELTKLIQNEIKWSNNNHITLYQLLHIFDDCILEVYSLMNDSFRRFTKTRRYQSLQLSVD